MNIVNGIRMVIAAAAVVLAASAALAAVSAATIAGRMNKDKYTTSEIKAYMKDLKGQTVTASGKVHDIQGQPRKKAKVVLVVPGAGKKGKFIVDVHMPQDDSKKFRKNDQVICTGDFVRYNIYTLNGITLRGACRK